MIQRVHQDLVFFQFELLASEGGLVHGISSRHGGVSAPPYDTLNLSYSVGDAPEAVDANRERFASALGVAGMTQLSARQVHGAAVHVADAHEPGAPAEADILVTNQPGRVLLQRFADCTPILLWDPSRRAVASAHAGWRGTTAGVAEVAVRALTTRYGSRPEDILAGIGPSIGPCCYEVGPEVVQACSPDVDRLSFRNGGKAVFDLWESNRGRLRRAGVPSVNIELAGLCTRCHSDMFFSHRAAGGTAGRFGSIFGLAG